MKINNYFDVVIVGGGVAGCIAAMSLPRSYSVAIIDKLAEPVTRIGECLPAASRRILKKLDLLDGMNACLTGTGAKAHLSNNGTRSYWGSDRLQTVDALSNPDGFGWHLDRRAFELYLRQAAQQRGISCIWPAKLYNSYYEGGRWHIITATNSETPQTEPYTITAKFVIDAGGRQSNFIRQQHIERTHFDKLIACWATVSDKAQSKMSTIASAENGWWYSAPLPGLKRVIALQTDADLVDRIAIKDREHFIEQAMACKQMADFMNGNEGDVVFHGIVSANSTRLGRVAGRQWAAVGDAAMSFDPLSSQGMFNAMAGAMQLSELMLAYGVIEKHEDERMEQFGQAYKQQQDSIWAHYLRHKSLFYKQEQRWKDAPFWQRRLMPSVAAEKPATNG